MLYPVQINPRSGKRGEKNVHAESVTYGQMTTPYPQWNTVVGVN